MARYSLFVLKVPLISNQPTNQLTMESVCGRDWRLRRKRFGGEVSFEMRMEDPRDMW